MRKANVTLFIAALVCFTFNLASHAEAGSKTARPLVTEKIDETKLVSLEGSTPPHAWNKNNDRGPLADDYKLEHMQMQLKRSPEQEKALAILMDELHTPGSANFHKWLSEEQWEQSFGVNTEDVQKVANWLQSHGFTVETISGDGLVIQFSGTVGMVRSTFHTDMHNLQLKNGEKHISNMSDPKIPAALAGVVVGPNGLSNFFPHPLVKQLHKAGIDEQGGVHERTPSGQTLTGDYTYSGCGFISGTGSDCYAIVPGDAQKIYNVTPLYALSTPITGKNETIGLIEDSNYYKASDWTTFMSTFGLTSYGGTLAVSHPTGSSTCTNPGDVEGTDLEVELDIEYASAMAPAAAVVVESCADGTLFGGLLAVQNLAGAATISAPVISISYGYCEADDTTAEKTAFVEAYQHGVSRGMSIFVSSGDESSTSCDANAADAKHGINVSGWTSTPYNVSVGGTDFGDAYAGTQSTYWNASNSATYASAKSYIPEIPWNDSCASELIATKEGTPTTYGSAGFCNTTTGKADFLTTASGSGGPSNCYTGTPSKAGVGTTGTCAGQPKPSWQSVLGNPADGVRDIPDVSLFAANGVWNHYIVICYTNTAVVSGATCTGAPSGWVGVGGTSASSPMMAGIQTLVNQYTGEVAGNPNYVYYTMASTEYGATGSTTCNSTLGNGAGSSCIFYDVTQGDNNVNCLKDGTTLYNCYLPSGTNGVGSLTTSAYSPIYNTGTGWDFATGIGSVNAYNLVTNWQNATAGGYPKTPVPTITGTVPSYTYGTTQSADTLTGAVSGNGSYPTGSVLFSYGLSTNPISGYTAIGTDTLAASAGCATGGTCTESATQSFTPSATLTPGTYHVDTTYTSVNENYMSGVSSATPIVFTVSKQTLTYSAGSVTPSSVVYATSTTVALSMKASWTGTGVTAPTITDFSFVLNSVTYTASCTGSSSPYTCTATVPAATVAALSVGSYPATFAFAGDANYAATSGTAVGTLTITAATPVFGTMTFSPAASEPHGTNQAITISDTVAYAGAAPTGAVTYVLNGVTYTATCSGASPETCSATVPGATIAALAVNAYTVTASIAAAGNYGAATGASGTFTITATSSTATFGTMAFAPAATEVFGTSQAITISDTLAYTGGSAPTGAVTYVLNSVTYTASCTGSSSPLTCTATVPAGTIAALPVNSYTVTAALAAGGGYSATTGTSGTFTITKAGTTSAMTSPTSGSPVTQTAGSLSAFTVTGTLSWAGAGADPTASDVTFSSTAAGTFSTVNCTSVSGSPYTCSATFTPTGTDTAGNYNINMAFSGDANYTSSASTQVGNYVIKAAATGTITFSSVNHNMGSVQIGSTSAAYGVTMSNTSNTAVTFTSISLNSSASPNPFSLATNCGTSLAANSSCQIAFEYAPVAGDSGTETATWSVVGAPGGTTFSPSNGGTLTGTVAASGNVTLTTAGHNFGDVTVGTTSGTYGTVLTNSTNNSVALTLGSVTSPFAIVTNCGANLAAGASCNLNFTFSPTADGLVQQVYSLAANGGAVPILVGGNPTTGITLTGTGD